MSPELEASPWAREVKAAVAAVRSAATAVRRHYDDATAQVYAKADESPVTDADLEADALIREVLQAAFPDDALLSEETADDPARLDKRRCWIADPLDGTREFVRRTGEFDVFLALVVDGVPVVGVSAHPLSDEVLCAAEGAGAWRIHGDGALPIRFKPAEQPPRVVSSAYYTDEVSLPLLRRVARRAGARELEILEIGFQPRAFAMDETGLARYDAFIGVGHDLFGPAYAGGEHDFAAGDVIVREAGGAFTNLRGERFRYNKPVPRNVGGLLASVDPTLHAALLEAFAAELSAAAIR